jgi:hypothetical protein
MFITVTAAHRRYSYIVVEDLDAMLASFSCLASNSLEHTALELSFESKEAYDLAKKMWYWRTLLFVTQHSSCGSSRQRKVFK